MRKVLCLAILMVLIFQLTGCDNSTEKAPNAVVFYYVHNNLEYGTASGVITSTVVNPQNSADSYHELLETYFNGPTNYDCTSPFPAGITLEDFQIDNNKAQLLLSPHMSTISGSSLTVALACLTRTVIEMTNVETVQIRIQNHQINGADTLTLSLNSFVYWDNIESVDKN